VRALVRPHPAATGDVAALAAAAELIDRLEVEAAQVAALRAELLEQALLALDRGRPVPAVVLGSSHDSSQPSQPGAVASSQPGAVASSQPGAVADERGVRFALEAAYREMARAAHGMEKIRLVDLANAARPRTRT
jgi:serine/threonine-protein kinase PknG